ncbi:MAG: tetratricopeptide repeat protein [Thermoplasmatota archaeon]
MKEEGQTAGWMGLFDEAMVSSVKCSFCSSREARDEEIPFCDTCWSALENGKVPTLDFKQYFIEGLEVKLADVDSLLFNMPNNFFLWYLKGHLEHELGSTKKALNSIKTSISYKEDFGDSWVRLGLIYSDLHKDVEAIDYFKRGLEHPLMDPSNLVDAGISLQASDQLKMASEVLKKALELVPDDDRGIVILGKVLFQMGELEEAQKVFEKGIELYPHNEEVLRGMAQILLRMEMLDDAMDMYSRILDQHPRDFEALLAKGEIHLRKDELTQSIKSYRAVKDLDIHISWGGILRFILSSLRLLVERNENPLSYREDLKKEYENILLFLKELDQKALSAQGPEMLDEVESLVKVIEHLKISLKEQVGQFQDLLERYKVEDSFHQHLSTKVANLKEYLAKGRFFDAKQIALELTPFLTDLRSMDIKDDGKVKMDLKKKLKEVRDIGMENKDLEIRLEEVEKLEDEGKLEGATFMLKELEVSLEEYYLECSAHFHGSKLREMETLMNEAKNQFDTSGLQSVLNEFMDQTEAGPRAIRQGYLKFIKRHEEDSSSFYSKETERLLKESDYKLVILEKDRTDTAEIREHYDDLVSEIDGGLSPREAFNKTQKLMEKVKSLEEAQKVSNIRSRLRSLDTLLGEVDFLGMDDALARNVEPVRRVIERSLKQNNYRLSEILTNEVFENVEKILRENYMEEIKDLIQSTEGELLRLRGLGIEKKGWMTSLEKVRGVLTKRSQGWMTEVISNLAKIQTDIQNFYVENLPDEIDRKIGDCRALLFEGRGYDLEMDGLEKELDRLNETSREISTLDLLEDSYKLESEMEVQLRSKLAEEISRIGEDIRRMVDEVTELGADQQEIMEILTLLNKAEILIESDEQREAFELIKEGKERISSVMEGAMTDLKSKRIEDIDVLISLAGKMGLDVAGFEGDRSVLVMEKEPNIESDVELANAIYSGLREVMKKGTRDLYASYRSEYKEVLDRTANLLPEGMAGEMRRQLKDFKEIIKNEQFTEVPQQVRSSRKLLDKALDKAMESSYLERCSEILEIGFSIDDDRAKTIIKSTQDLTQEIKKGKREGVGDRIRELQGEVKSLKSLFQMQFIESMLSEMQELDSLANEVFKNIEEDEFREKIDSINGRMKKILDSSSDLYGNPDDEMISSMNSRMNQLKDDIVELENNWRARKRLNTLKDMKLTEDEVNGSLLAEDIENLNVHYDAADWNKFFRTWERVESQIKKMEKSGILPGGSSEQVKTSAPGHSPGIDILTRKRMLVGTKSDEALAGKTPGKKIKGDGIKRLALDMAQKRKLMEEGSREGGPVQEKTAPPTEKESNEVSVGDMEDIAGIARLIAIERIEELRRSDSKALGDPEEPFVIWDISDSEEVPSGKLVNEMEDLLEIDISVQPQAGVKIDIRKLREKLVGFLDKLPPLPQLNEARDYLDKGDESLSNNDEDSSFEHYRRSLGIAIKVGRVHADMAKALKTVKTTLHKMKEKGRVSKGAEKLYKEAEALFKKGDLLGCAKTIKGIKIELTKNG